MMNMQPPNQQGSPYFQYPQFPSSAYSYAPAPGYPGPQFQPPNMYQPFPFNPQMGGMGPMRPLPNQGFYPTQPINRPSPRKQRQAREFNTQIEDERVYCVICQNEYKSSEREEHVKRHQRQDRGNHNKIKKLLIELNSDKEPASRPIIEPEEFNVQYDPNRFVLEREQKFNTPVQVKPPNPQPGIQTVPDARTSVQLHPGDGERYSNIERGTYRGSNRPVETINESPEEYHDSLPHIQSQSFRASSERPSDHLRPSIDPQAQPYQPENVRISYDNEELRGMTYNDYRSHQMVRKPKEEGIYLDQNRSTINQPASRGSMAPSAGMAGNDRFGRDTFVSDQQSNPDMGDRNLYNRDTLVSQTQESYINSQSNVRRTGAAISPIREVDQRVSNAHQAERVSLDNDSFENVNNFNRSGSHYNRQYNPNDVIISLKQYNRASGATEPNQDRNSKIALEGAAAALVTGGAASYAYQSRGESNNYESGIQNSSGYRASNVHGSRQSPESVNLNGDTSNFSGDNLGGTYNSNSPQRQTSNKESGDYSEDLRNPRDLQKIQSNVSPTFKHLQSGSNQSDRDSNAVRGTQPYHDSISGISGVGQSRQTFQPNQNQSSVYQSSNHNNASNLRSSEQENEYFPNLQEKYSRGSNQRGSEYPQEGKISLSKDTYENIDSFNRPNNQYNHYNRQYNQEDYNRASGATEPNQDRNSKIALGGAAAAALATGGAASYAYQNRGESNNYESGIQNSQYRTSNVEDSRLPHESVSRSVNESVSIQGDTNNFRQQSSGGVYNSGNSPHRASNQYSQGVLNHKNSNTSRDGDRSERQSNDLNSSRGSERRNLAAEPDRESQNSPPSFMYKQPKQTDRVLNSEASPQQSKERATYNQNLRDSNEGNKISLDGDEERMKENKVGSFESGAELRGSSAIQIDQENENSGNMGIIRQSQSLSSPSALRQSSTRQRKMNLKKEEFQGDRQSQGNIYRDSNSPAQGRETGENFTYNNKVDLQNEEENIVPMYSFRESSRRTRKANEGQIYPDAPRTSQEANQANSLATGAMIGASSSNLFNSGRQSNKGSEKSGERSPAHLQSGNYSHQNQRIDSQEDKNYNRLTGREDQGSERNSNGSRHSNYGIGNGQKSDNYDRQSNKGSERQSNHGFERKPSNESGRQSNQNSPSYIRKTGNASDKNSDRGSQKNWDRGYDKGSQKGSERGSQKSNKMDKYSQKDSVKGSDRGSRQGNDQPIIYYDEQPQRITRKESGASNKADSINGRQPSERQPSERQPSERQPSERSANGSVRGSEKGFNQPPPASNGQMSDSRQSIPFDLVLGRAGATNTHNSKVEAYKSRKGPEVNIDLARPPMPSKKKKLPTNVGNGW